MPDNADRLCAAADACLKVLARDAVNDVTQAPVLPSERMGEWNEPEELKDYTRAEVEESQSFLFRLGILVERSGD